MINPGGINAVAPAPTNLNRPIGVAKEDGAGSVRANFNDAVKNAGKYVSNVSDLQKASNESVMDLLTGKSSDINSMVSAVAKADMSFKLLLGVRNKLIEAYKQTMNMPL